MSRTTFLALKRESHPINLEPTRTLLLMCTAGPSHIRHARPLARLLARQGRVSLRPRHRLRSEQA